MKYKFTKKQKRLLIRIIVSAAVFAVGIGSLFLFPSFPWIGRGILIASYLVAGYDVLRKAALGVVRGRIFDENFLMAVASLGAMALTEFSEAAAVMIFYQTGELFQSVAVGKSRKSVAALTEIRPDTANLVGNDGVTEVDPEDVSVGSVIAVYPGERIPLDGEIIEGRTTLDAAALTGEAIPVEAGEGDSVVSGCVNVTGAIKVRTTKEFTESTATRILELVEDSTSRKSRPEAFITRFAKYYTPAVCGTALALALIPPLASLFFGGDPAWREWISRALTFLVVSCPCALVLSVPMAFFGGIGCASKNGILVKGANYLELLAKAEGAVFDKTGTLTEGKFRVSRVESLGGLSEEDIIKYAAFAESVSTHPVGVCIREACPDKPAAGDVKEISEIPGRGVEATVLGRRVFVGKSENATFSQSTPGVTVSVLIDGKEEGRITASDTVKESAKDALAALRSLGVKKTYMLTGDRENSARLVADAVGVDGVRAGLLPADKVGELEKIMKESSPVLYAGDGINDAPVLARADVGVAMGALGSDAAIEAADVVIMDDDMKRLPLAVRIARKTVRIAKENIVFSLAVKAACLILGALGIAGMWVAIFADVGVMILAVLNSARALRIK